MTNQEAFDKMMSHLRSLREPSTNHLGECAYNGSKCAIGVLMTDEEQEKFGGYKGTVGGLVWHMEEEGHNSALFDLDDLLLEDMQALHDSCASWGRRGFINEARAERITRHHGLVYTAPETNN